MTNELKPVPCGCGGEAKIKKHTFYKGTPTYGVECTNCHAESWQFYDTEAEAITVWNKAMGAVRESRTTERTSEVIEHEMIITDPDGCEYHRTKYLCGNCKKKVLAGDDYCSHCGCRLIWSGVSDE